MKIKKKVLSRKKFNKYMDAIRKSDGYVCELNSLSDKYGGEGYLFPPNCVDELVKLLEYVFDDKGEWIEYFIYELDFGTEYHDGDVTEEDKNIPLATVDDLYDLLISNLERNDDV